MTKTRNTVMNRERNETEKGKGTKKWKKTKIDNSKQLELPNSITWFFMVANKYSQNRMQKYFAVTDVISGIVQSVLKSQMLDTSFSQVLKQKTLLGSAKAVYNQPRWPCWRIKTLKIK